MQMQLPPAIDYLFHSGEFIAFLTVAWIVIKRVNRDETLKKDYPPHRHINGTKIMYPAEYPPPEIETFGVGRTHHD